MKTSAVDLVISVADLRRALANAEEASRRNGGDVNEHECLVVTFPVNYRTTSPMIHTHEAKSVTLSGLGASNTNPFNPARHVWSRIKS